VGRNFFKKAGLKTQVVGGEGGVGRICRGALAHRLKTFREKDINLPLGLRGFKDPQFQIS
jgi:hypothetical protein